MPADQPTNDWIIALSERIDENHRELSAKLDRLIDQRAHDKAKVAGLSAVVSALVVAVKSLLFPGQGS